MGPHVGAVISCVQERIMLPIRLLMWRKSMPIYRLQSPSALCRQPRLMFNNCPFTKLPINSLIGPLAGSFLSHVQERIMLTLRLVYSCDKKAFEFIVYNLQVHSTENGGRYFIIAHLIYFHWILWQGPLLGSVFPCVQERIMLAVRLLMWGISIPFHRLQFPSAFR